MRTQYLYDDVTGACIAEFDENGDTQVEYTTNPQTGELISENHNGQEVYHRYDGEGNTRQTTDSAGNVLGEATYDASGETVAESGNMKTTYRFRGQQGFSTDPLSGDVSKANQNYSPPIGRRLSRVHLGGARFDPGITYGYETYRAIARRAGQTVCCRFEVSTSVTSSLPYYKEVIVRAGETSFDACSRLKRTFWFQSVVLVATIDAKCPDLLSLSYGHYCGPGRKANIRDCEDVYCEDGMDVDDIVPQPIDKLDEACFFHDCCLRGFAEYLLKPHHRKCNDLTCNLLKAVDCSSAPDPLSCSIYLAGIRAGVCIAYPWPILFP